MERRLLQTKSRKSFSFQICKGKKLLLWSNKLFRRRSNSKPGRPIDLQTSKRTVQSTRTITRKGKAGNTFTMKVRIIKTTKNKNTFQNKKILTSTNLKILKNIIKIIRSNNCKRLILIMKPVSRIKTVSSILDRMKGKL